MLITHPVYCLGQEWVGAISPLSLSAFMAVTGKPWFNLLYTWFWRSFSVYFIKPKQFRDDKALLQVATLYGAVFLTTNAIGIKKWNLARTGILFSSSLYLDQLRVSVSLTRIPKENRRPFLQGKARQRKAVSPFVLCRGLLSLLITFMPCWLIDGLIDYIGGETMSQNCGHQRAYCSSPGWYVNMESHGDDEDAV
jgi:hypothetical protein